MKTSAFTPDFSILRPPRAFCAASSARPNHTSLVNAIFDPSGDHTGPPAPVESDVSARAPDAVGVHQVDLRDAVLLRDERDRLAVRRPARIGLAVALRDLARLALAVRARRSRRGGGALFVSKLGSPTE